MKYRVNELTWGFKTNKNGFNGESFLVIDNASGSVIISKNENEKYNPASIAKLFVIDYILTMADKGTIIEGEKDALKLVKKGSSKADLNPDKYTLENLIAAMLVPSGNDAAYVVANHFGNLIYPNAQNIKDRIKYFMNGLGEHLKTEGYDDTVLYDPSGYDYDAKTSVKDIESVTNKLLKHEWIRNIVKQATYTTTLPNGKTVSWKNTNDFLNDKSKVYNPKVEGMKTGSLGDVFNLVVLYNDGDREFLICSLGSHSNKGRYEDVSFIIKTIDQLRNCVSSNTQKSIQ
ncbi:D-alanyl-D-alanine carboxypeptidase family protein [Microaceticoccus formicicus]|uniref:D-alanyl-D-alanine carboxypeptidase family protein n=1 Tax=Microaceticoccus formicicus TaxID=3118105 RepID=UPI003CD05148|nr:serine hydrolase [Peptoniphilaceae bacterium AMB_02]